MRPSIRRNRTEDGALGEGWDLTRPPFGFTTEPRVSNHSTWADARRALLSPASASGAQYLQLEVGGYGPGLYRSSPRTPRWIEASKRSAP